MENEAGRFTLIFLGVPGDEGGEVELTHNWDESGYGGGRNFGHLAYQVDDIYETCQRLMDAGVTINRPPRDGHMAFVRSPDDISIELLQKGSSLPRRSPGRRCRTPASGDGPPDRQRRSGPQRQLRLADPRSGQRRDGGRRSFGRRARPGCGVGGGPPHYAGSEHALAPGPYRRKRRRSGTRRAARSRPRRKPSGSAGSTGSYPKATGSRLRVRKP